MAAKLRAHQVDVDPDFAPQSRPRSCTWPLPQPDLAGDEDGALGTGVAEGAEDCGLERRVTAPAMAPAPPLGAEVGPLRKAKSSRRNAWGNLSYADLITKAIESAPDKRLTLSQIYDWMVRYVPYFKDKGDSNSSAGWKVGASGWRQGLGCRLGFPGRAVGEGLWRTSGVRECVPWAWGWSVDRWRHAGNSCVRDPWSGGKWGGRSGIVKRYCLFKVFLSNISTLSWRLVTSPFPGQNIRSPQLPQVCFLPHLFHPLYQDIL